MAFERRTFSSDDSRCFASDDGTEWGLDRKCDPVIGYLHRGDEKIAENMTYNQFVPYTDRLDYLAPLANNAAYAITVERLGWRRVPERCQAIRVIVCEMARISSHLLGMGVLAWMRELGPHSCTLSRRGRNFTPF